jgi:hypothetical protein
MHKLEKLILEAYGQLLNEMDGGRLFDYFNNKGYKISERSSDGGVPGFEGYMVSKGESRSPQAVIFQHNKDTDEFTISRMSGYRIDQDEAIKAGMREKSSSAVAGIDGYMTDGNYTPVSISVEDLKDIVDHVMTGLDREAEAQRDFYARRGPVSGTIDEERQLVHVYDKDGSIYGTGEVVGVDKDKTIVRFDGHTVKRFPDERVKPVMEDKDDESFDLEKEFEENPRLTRFKDLPADMQKKFSKEIKVFGKNAPGDPNRDYVDADYETYYFTTSYNKQTGSVGHRIVKLPSYAKLYNSFVKIIKDIKTLMGVDAVKSDEQAKALFEDIKTLFRQLQRYLRTNHPKQYDLMKMRRMAEGIKKAKTLLESNFNLKEGEEKTYKGKDYKVTLEKGRKYTLKGVHQATYKENPSLSKDRAHQVAKQIHKSLSEGEGDDYHYLKIARPADIKKALTLLQDSLDTADDVYGPGHRFETDDNDGAGNMIVRFYGPEAQALAYDSVIMLRAYDFDIPQTSVSGLDEEVTDQNFVKGIDVIKQTLSKEGGAAGLEPLVKELVKLGFTENEVVELLKKMTSVKQHRDGDYILLPLEEKMDINDPFMIKLRQAKMHADDMKKLDAYRKSPEGKAAARAQASAERKEVKAREIVRKLKIKRAQVMSDMENDPDIEPEGGPVADMYGDQLNKIDNAIEKAASVYNKNMSYDQAVGKINEFIGGNTEKRLSALFNKLVPGSGNADTVEGEIIRALNRIIYRWGNDGDRFWYGYGAETVGPAMEYLTDASDIPSEIRNKFKAWENDNFGKDYGKKELEDLAQIALQYVEMKVKEDDLSQNDDDIFNYGQTYKDHVRDMEDEEDEYDDYYDDDDEYEDDEDYYNEDKGQEISKANMDGYKKGNLRENLLDKVNEQEPEESPDLSAPKETVLEDATDQMLSKFPTLKAAIIKLQTEDFKEFVDSIDWISPRPTTFRINLKNGQDYILKWTGKTFQAQIMGKRYFIDKINDYQQALDKLNILYKEGPMSGAGEEDLADPIDTSAGGGGGGDFPGDDAAAGGGEEAPAADVGGGEEEGGADLAGEPVDFEEPAEEPEA